MTEFTGTLDAPVELWERQFGAPVLQTRADEGSLEEMIARLRPVRISPWRSATNREAMGVPAVFKAVSLISNTVGTLSMEAFRNGVRLSAAETPAIVKRPDPFTPPQPFWRDSAYYKARLGETWWWVARRDLDDVAMSLVCVDPRQVNVEPDPDDYFRPIITWTTPDGRTRRMPNRDMIQQMYLRDPRNPLRGWGPLQACGAAVSVAVEAQEWAANFFAGNPSNTVIKSAEEVDAAEALVIKERWMSGASNLPKVIDPGIESVTEIGTDPDKAQLSDVRLFQNGEIALMFSMPPTLLNYAVQGSTITYQNVGQVADDFARQTLLPHYLEPMEQAMSDLLTRSTTTEFNIKRLLRADIKTRYDVYAIGIDKQIISPEEAREEEGLGPGGVETRPIPFAPPSAVPTSLPVQVRSAPPVAAVAVVEPVEVRCHGTRSIRGRLQRCNNNMGALAPGSRVTCRKCKSEVAA